MVRVDSALPGAVVGRAHDKRSRSSNRSVGFGAGQRDFRIKVGISKPTLGRDDENSAAHVRRGVSWPRRPNVCIPRNLPAGPNVKRIRLLGGTASSGAGSQHERMFERLVERHFVIGVV